MFRPLTLAAACGLLALPGICEATATDSPAAPIIQCPKDDLLEAPLTLRLREMALTPGKTIDPSVIMKDPEVAEFVHKAAVLDQERKRKDWAGLCHYRADNAVQQAKRAPTVVFFGDSITENWIDGDPELFSDRMIDRGISGQTSAQILLRFQADVVALHPKVVHIMAGTNDILQDLAATTDDDVVNNISAMLDLAQVHHIKVVLASILPISVRSWQPSLFPAPRVARLNQRLRDLAARRGAIFIDYNPVLQDKVGGLRADLGNDGVHPNRAGYAVMRPLADQAIAQALR